MTQPAHKGRKEEVMKRTWRHMKAAGGGIDRPLAYLAELIDPKPVIPWKMCSSALVASLILV